jgi:hypothetical protein
MFHARVRSLASHAADDGGSRVFHADAVVVQGNADTENTNRDA